MEAETGAEVFSRAYAAAFRSTVRSRLACMLSALFMASPLCAQWATPSVRNELTSRLDTTKEDTVQLICLSEIATCWMVSKRATPYLARLGPLCLKLMQDPDPAVRRVALQQRSRFLFMSGYHAKFERDIPAALNYFRQASAMGLQVGDTVGASGSLDAMGVLFRALGQPQRSLALHQESLDLLRYSSGSAPVNVHSTLVHMAEVHTDLGDYAGSEELLASCPAIKGYEVTISRGRARMAERQGDRKKAIAYLQQALTEASLSPNAWDSVTVLAPLARTRLNDGDLSGAMRTAHECVRLSGRLGDEAACIGCLVISGEARMLAKDLAGAERDLRRALDMAEEFHYVGLFRESGDDGSMLRATEMLKNLYRLQGRLPEAMDMTDRWVALKDTLARMDGRVDVLQFEMREEMITDSLSNAEAARVAEVGYQRSLEAERYRKNIIALISIVGILALVVIIFDVARRRAQERKFATLEVRRLQQRCDRRPAHS